MLRFLSVLFAVVVDADCYLQKPMGSNNRLDDENRDRNNADRLFDTQNNNRGGYNVGNVFYIGDTHIPMKWTTQHSCGQANNNCEIIIQMMCDRFLRDGTTTKTIPVNPIECYNWDCDTDVRYGRHESFTSYQACKKTERNKGLFLADQNVKGHVATYTRQNPNGARRGYECPEERDYYPYWRPSEWVDIAYFTNDYPAKCDAVIAQANKPKYSCQVAEKYLYMKDVFNSNNPLPNTQRDCEFLKVDVPVMEPVIDPKTKKQVYENGVPLEIEKKDINGKVIKQERNPAVWELEKFSAKKQELIDAIDKVQCLDNKWQRDNHHGNILGGFFAGFDWKVPNVDRENCALRIRYNISTTDLPKFESNLTTGDIWMKNKEGENVLDVKGRYYVGQKLGFNKTEIDENGYYYKTNPQVAPFYNYPTPNAMDTEDGPLKFQLAVNTAQFGRVFQDRTHRFSIKKRTEKQKDMTIHNLGVRGKRGNIVQVYPATEYSFQPEELNVQVGDYVHFQWVGSNTNPNNNAGQGRQGSDRHNIAQLRNAVYAEDGQIYKNGLASFKSLPVFGQFGGSYPEKLDGSSFLGLSKKNREMLASLKGINTNGGELSELDDSGTWASFNLMKVTMEGIFHYLCTRNNNFSNRSQKGRITAQGVLAKSAEVTYSGATIVDGESKLEVGQGSSVRSIVELEIVGDKNSGWCNPCSSSFYLVAQPIPETDTGSFLTVPYVEDPARHPIVYHTTETSISTSKKHWNKIDSDCDNGQCRFEVIDQGLYVVNNKLDWWVYFLIAILIVLVIVGVFLLWKFKPWA